VSVSTHDRAAFEAHLLPILGDDWQLLGTVGGDSLEITTTDGQSLVAVKLAAITDSWANAIERRLAV
jgi:phosphoribosylformylglycinamidine synthase subunit PurL